MRGEYYLLSSSTAVSTASLYASLWSPESRLSSPIIMMSL